MSNKTPSRPNNVPAAAEWDSSKKQWQLGARNKNFNATGAWTSWHENGKLSWEATYDDFGNFEGAYKRYHPDGKLAQEGTYKKGKIHGWTTYYRQANSKEHFPYTYSQAITKATLFFIEGKEQKWFYYLQDGALCNSSGTRYPNTLPNTACSLYNEWGVFESGDYNDEGKKVGMWKRWRWDGYSPTVVLVEERNYDQAGNLHGWTREYHNDGTLAFEGEYISNNAYGTHHYWRTDAYSQNNTMRNDHKNIWHKVIIYKQPSNEEQYFLRNGEACNRNGKMIVNAQVTDLFQCQPDDFQNDNFEEFIRRIYNTNKRDTTQRERHAALFQDLWGIAMPAELANYYDTISRSQKAPTLYQYFETSAPYTHTPQQWISEGKNIVEQAILHAQKTYPYDYWMDWLTGAPALDRPNINPDDSYNSFSFHYGLYDQEHPIYSHRHYNYTYYGTSFDSVVASNLSSWLYFNSLFSSYAEFDVITEAAFVNQYPKLYSKIGLSSMYYYVNNVYARNRYLNSGDFNYYHSKSRKAIDAYNRNRWILELFRSEADINTTRSYIYNSAYRFPDWTAQEKSQRLSEIVNVVPEALFHLFAAYFCSNGEPYLIDVVNACSASSSRIVRDAAALVQSFMDGRKTLGYLRDIDQLRHSF